jgi:hypothetical protein
MTRPARIMPSMKLFIANMMSLTIDDHALSTVLTAIGEQVARDFQPEWHAGAALHGERIDLKKAHTNVPADAVIYLGDSSQDPTTGVKGAYGYHSTNRRDTPYGFVYLDICKHYHEDWSSTLSHEVLELLADPTAVKTVTGARPHGSRSKRPSVYYDLEVCDPTQGDTYSIHGVVVSNFVTKAYFGIPGGATSATNFRQLELAPFGVRPGGYFQYEDEHGAHEVDGEKVTPEHKAARKLLGAYRRNARRALTFKSVD